MAPISGERLLAKVSSPWPVAGLLGGVFATETLEQALAMRARLNDNESIFTRDGIWVGPNWLRVARDADEHAGVLHREQELKSLAESIAQHEERAAQLAQTLEDGRDTLREPPRRPGSCRAATTSRSRGGPPGPPHPFPDRGSAT